MYMLFDFVMPSLTRDTNRLPKTRDPLVCHGRHFARTVSAMCHVRLLIKRGLRYLDELAVNPDEGLSTE
jgi:hypothetical protein